VDYLVDTNVLLRFADRNHALHNTVRAAIRKLRQSGNQMCAVGQNFVEFWNVATRPIAQNGFGLTPTAADLRLRLLERIFPLRPDDPALYATWRRLVVAFGVSGVRVHDARLVAAMKSQGLTHILTFNTVDFARYAPEGIVAVDPASV
jgi:predicted nucleic acid-binding protein